MYQGQKSASTAGLLGIFLGSFGAHNWYLEDKKKGIIHVSLVGAGAILEVIAAIVAPKDALSLAVSLYGGGGSTILPMILSGLGVAVISGSAIWGVIEGIIILSQGDAGLASKGYAVAGAVPPAPQGYVPNQPMNGFGQMPQQGYYGQPMPAPQPMPGQQPPMPNQPMPQQGYYDQPMQPSQPDATNNAPDANQNITQNDSNAGGESNE